MIATRPASEPLRIIERSGLPSSSHAAAVAVSVAAAAALLVVTATWAMAGPLSAIVEPGLKPNQPNQRTKTPRVAVLMLWP